MALDTPQGTIGGGGGGRDFEADGPPDFNGSKTGQVVRKGGYVWEWNGQSGRTRWTKLRKTRATDLKRIPPYFDPNRKMGGSRSGGSAGGGSNGGGGGNASGGGRNRGGGGNASGGEDATGVGGVPAGGDLWKVGNRHYLVYTVKMGNKSLRMAWLVKGKGELDRITQGGQVKVTRTLKDGELRKMGVPAFGTTVELENQTEHPWLKFRSWFRDEVKVKPWLRDREMLALHAASWLETGNAPTSAQISQTRWWKTHTPNERAAIEKWGTEGPATFRDEWDRVREGVIDSLQAKGFDFAGGNAREIGNYFTRQIVWGKMSEDEFERVAEQVSNPHARDGHWAAGINSLPKGSRVVRHKGEFYIRYRGMDMKIHGAFAKAKFGGMGAVKVDKINPVGNANRWLRRVGERDRGRDAISGVERVRDIIQEWLGPRYSKGFSELEILRWAERIERNPDEENALVDRLRARREVALPDYDKNLTWRDIAATWQPVATSVWGEPLDEDSAEFERVVRLKDRAAAEQYLRTEGLKRNNEFVTNTLMDDMESVFGGAA